jgi:hypothetical protein
MSKINASYIAIVGIPALAALLVGGSLLGATLWAFWCHLW